MQARKNFGPILPAIGIGTRGFDFTRELATGETISAVEFTIEPYSGVDDGTSQKIGSAQIQGNIVLQQFGNLVAGVIYEVLAVVTTSAGNKPDAWAYLPCQGPPPPI